MTRWTMPAAAGVVPAVKNLQVPEAVVRWQTVVPDRVLSLTVAGGNVTAVSLDGSASVIRGGKAVSHRAVSPAEAIAAKKAAAVKPAVPAVLAKRLLADRVPKFIAAGNGAIAVAYWGGTLQVFASDGALRTQQLRPQDISALAWDGARIVVGQSDGSILAMESP